MPLAWFPMLPAQSPQGIPGSFATSLRFVGTSTDDTADLLASLRDAVALLATYPGFVSASIGRAVDDESLVLVQILWDNVGAYRRALSSYDVKLTVVPLLSRAMDEPSAFEVVHTRDQYGAIDQMGALAADAGSVSLGHAAAEWVPPAPS